MVSLGLQPSPSPQPGPCCNDQHTGFLCGEGSFCEHSTEPTSLNFRLDPSCHSFSRPHVSGHRSWDGEAAENTDREEVKFGAWMSRAGTVGRVAERVNDEWSLGANTTYLLTTDNPLDLDSTFSHSPVLQQPVSRKLSTYATVHSDSRRLWYGPSPAADVLPSSSEGGATPPNHGSKCWTGRERKRSEQAAGLVRTGV